MARAGALDAGDADGAGVDEAAAPAVADATGSPGSATGGDAALALGSVRVAASADGGSARPQAKTAAIAGAASRETSRVG